MAWFVLANGEITDYDWLITVLRGSAFVCADGGANHAYRIKCRPNLVVGDMDSVTPETKAWLEVENIPILKAPRAKDETDTRLALEWIIANQSEVDTIGLLAGTGDRLDHTLANLQLLLTAYYTSIKLQVLTATQATFLVTPEWPASFNNVGREVSLLAVTPEVRGITTTKLEYPLHNGSITFANPIGISNVVEDKGATVTVKEGILMAIANTEV